MKTIPLFRCVKNGGRYPQTSEFAIVGCAKVDEHWFDCLVGMGLWLEVKGKKTCYARLRGVGNLRMHQIVFGGPNADHIDGDGLNNQESNLRPATGSQQAANQSLRRTSTSGEPGVSWHKLIQSWQVRVYKDRKIVFSNYFKSFDEAVRVARAKRKEIHGEFVR